MTELQLMLSYFRLAAYSIVFFTSLFSMVYGIQRVRAVFIGNMIFVFFATLSLISYVFLSGELERAVGIFVTTGALLWAAILYTNFVTQRW